MKISEKNQSVGVEVLRPSNRILGGGCIEFEINDKSFLSIQRL